MGIGFASKGKIVLKHLYFCIYQTNETFDENPLAASNDFILCKP